MRSFDCGYILLRGWVFYRLQIREGSNWIDFKLSFIDSKANIPISSRLRVNNSGVVLYVYAFR